MSVQIISRSSGRSAVAAAAYRSGEKLHNEYDGLTHDYTAKGGVEYSDILLPDHAPVEWANRGKLWNAVEMAEKQRNSALAREINIALPKELSRQEQINLVRDYCQANFVSAGMVADINIHDPPQRDGDGRIMLDAGGNQIHNNPHAHIMLTVRPIDQNGKWESKSQKAYVCERAGETRNMTAAEYKVASREGWEKRYQYQTAVGKAWMTPSTAAAFGLTQADRVSKYSQDVRINNPSTDRWDSKDALQQWRADWAERCNELLRDHGAAEIDHRSYTDRGIEQVPTAHLGVEVSQMEARGIQTDKGNRNREARQINNQLRLWRDQINTLAKRATERGREVIYTAARKLEQLRSDWIHNDYGVRDTGRQIIESQRMMHSNQRLLQDVTDYGQYQQEANQLQLQCSNLMQIKDHLSPLQMAQRRKYNDQLAQSAERLEYLSNRLQTISGRYGWESQDQMQAAAERASQGLQDDRRLHDQLRELEADRDQTKDSYKIQCRSIPESDRMDVIEIRQSIRPDIDNEIRQSLQEDYGLRYDDTITDAAIDAAEKELGGRLENGTENEIERNTEQKELVREYTLDR